MNKDEEAFLPLLIRFWYQIFLKPDGLKEFFKNSFNMLLKHDQLKKRAYTGMIHQTA